MNRFAAEIHYSYNESNNAKLIHLILFEIMLRFTLNIAKINCFLIDCCFVGFTAFVTNFTLVCLKQRNSFSI